MASSTIKDNQIHELTIQTPITEVNNKGTENWYYSQALINALPNNAKIICAGWGSPWSEDVIISGHNRSIYFQSYGAKTIPSNRQISIHYILS